MFENQEYRGDTEQSPIMDGTPVYDSNGDKVGEVAEHGMQRTALIVKKGMLFTTEVYVPLAMIQRRDTGGVYLSLAKSEMSHQNWTMPPIEENTNPTTSGIVGAGLHDTVPGAAAGVLPPRDESLDDQPLDS